MKILREIDKVVSVITFAVLAIIFKAWWISLFGLLVPLCSDKEEKDDVHTNK